MKKTIFTFAILIGFQALVVAQSSTPPKTKQAANPTTATVQAGRGIKQDHQRVKQQQKSAISATPSKVAASGPGSATNISRNVVNTARPTTSTDAKAVKAATPNTKMGTQEAKPAPKK
jgi:hypothetical protein